ncbi:hypothetical protein BD310DRAFT_933273 [Dichomitus squalens]|uniref:Uncharacterized protein n=1 Tax=Dichomitus squalens TaxID=114155 RepID=A0A4Q9PN69_9APHY|nr:hypothetical protein BD310DRAFT_933273 [Dichomitus squalens]
MGSASSPLCHGPHKSSCRRSPSCPSVHRAHIERRRRATIVVTVCLFVNPIYTHSRVTLI